MDKKFIGIIFFVFLLFVFGGCKQSKTSETANEESTIVETDDEYNEDMTYERKITIKYESVREKQYPYDWHITTLESNYPNPQYHGNDAIFSGIVVIPSGEEWTLDSYNTKRIVYHSDGRTEEILYLNPPKNQSYIQSYNDVQQNWVKDFKKVFSGGDCFVVYESRLNSHDDDADKVELEVEVYFTSNQLKRKEEEIMYPFKDNQVEFKGFTNEESVFDYLTKERYKETNSYDSHTEFNSSKILMSIKNDKCVYYNGTCVLKSLTLTDFNKIEVYLNARPVKNTAWLWEKPDRNSGLKPVWSNDEDTIISVYVNREERTITIGEKMYFKRDGYDK